MINNRQAGRRRGRGGQRTPGGNSGRPDNGNRIDNRARGNAAQLLEKYKSLARDAQMQGDRVNTEYYLQFADHYFRVLSETRSRFEENQQRRGGANDAFDEEIEDDGEGDSFADDRVDGDRAHQANGNRRDVGSRDQGRNQNRDQRREFGSEQGRDQGRDDRRADRGDGQYRPEPRISAADGRDERAGDADLGVDSAVEGRGDRARRGRPRRAPQTVIEEAPAAIEVDRLPPSLSLSATDGDTGGAEGEAGPKPRRRRRAAASEEAAAS
ncbi:MAG: DUF4167 domain-containing protein [Sphingomonas sp.]|nr:DUF4167 domain-containing protein [Zymomonas sp.]MBA4774017.1 DUF4167 domain-containing protein [Sphingomonas sp.]PZP18180.1 MAG: DUF4167 domain-containing protein [Sphingomonas hengshuiensis]